MHSTREPVKPKEIACHWKRECVFNTRFVYGNSLEEAKTHNENGIKYVSCAVKGPVGLDTPAREGGAVAIGLFSKLDLKHAGKILQRRSGILVGILTLPRAA